MKTAFVSALLLSTAMALSGHGRGGVAHRHHAARSLKNGPHHAQIAARGSSPSANYNDRLRLGRRAIEQSQRFNKRNIPARALSKRKVLGKGDVTSFPSNAAEGTFTAAQGCTCWHTVASGEVCLGLIDKSSAGFTLDTFYKYNPSVGSGCSGLQVGTAYCVDNGKNTEPSDSTSGASKSANLKLAATNTGSAATATSTDALDEPVDGDDGEDCDEDDGDGSDDGDDEDCDEEDDGDDEEDCDEEDNGDDYSSSASSGSNSGSSNGANAPQLKVGVSASIGDSEPSSTWSAQGSQQTGGSSSGGGYSGIATYYYQKGNAGACGEYNPDSAYIVALYTSVYNGGAHCGKQVKLTNTDTGVSVTATVADECPTCGGDGDIDTSEAVFNVLSNNNLGAGVENVKWEFV